MAQHKRHQHGDDQRDSDDRHPLGRQDLANTIGVRRARARGRALRYLGRLGYLGRARCGPGDVQREEAPSYTRWAWVATLLEQIRSKIVKDLPHNRQDAPAALLIECALKIPAVHRDRAKGGGRRNILNGPQEAVRDSQRDRLRLWYSERIFHQLWYGSL